MPGTFSFRPIQANLTHDTDWLGKMDPYCSYRVGPQRIKGPICRNGGKFPKWEDATVNVPATNEPSMVVDLMDKDKVLFDDNIGSFVIDLQEVQNRGQLSKWYPVYYRQKPAGEILLEAAYQPEFIQQQQQPLPVIQEPVLIQEKIVQEPVIVEKIVQEEFIQPTTQTTQKEFVSGPIIHGISQIHHGGQGIGLVPKHGPILAESSTIQQGGIIQSGSNLQQGTLYQGTSMNQGLNQGGLIQGGSNLQQGNLYQGSNLNQGGITQGGSNLQQSNLYQGEFNQGNLCQNKF
jgi:hypothetical protein